VHCAFRLLSFYKHHAILCGCCYYFAMMITLDFSGLHLRLAQENDKTTVYDLIRKKWVILTPEEHVRQYLLLYFLHILRYPASLIAVEKKITVGKMVKRFDVVVFDRTHKPWLLAECKEPQVILSENTLFQLLSYNHALPCAYWLLTNGHQAFCADAKDIQSIKWLETLPLYEN